MQQLKVNPAKVIVQEKPNDKRQFPLRWTDIIDKILHGPFESFMREKQDRKE